jgi:hypothetical protein
VDNPAGEISNQQWRLWLRTDRHKNLPTVAHLVGLNSHARPVDLGGNLLATSLSVNAFSIMSPH